jgi:hypothetical protein
MLLVAPRIEYRGIGDCGKYLAVARIKKAWLVAQFFREVRDWRVDDDCR